MKTVQYISMIQNVTTCVAQRAFELLEGDLTPHVVAVGIATDEKGVQTCVEPEACMFDAADFSGFHTLVARLSANDGPLSNTEDSEERLCQAMSEAFESLAAAKTDPALWVT